MTEEQMEIEEQTDLPQTSTDAELTMEEPRDQSRDFLDTHAIGPFASNRWTIAFGFQSEFGKYGIVLQANEISADQLDALLVPGGWAPDKLRRDRNILQLVQNLNVQNKILGFICHAGWVAASADICKGKRVTGSTGIKDDMENAGAIWVDKPALREGNLVWGRVVADIPDYCRELIKALS